MMKNIFSQLLYKMQKRFGLSKKDERREQGQVLVIVTLSVIALTAIVGLAVDTGLLYLSHGKLRRAVDAAALAATAQFREGYSTADLQKAAYEFLVLNGINDPSAIVETCETNPADQILCPQLVGKPARKLVRVKATSVVRLTFLSVIGIRQTTVSAQAVSEAASMDVVLAIDTSDSMTWDADPADPMYDPSQCNPVNDCHPFKEVKDAAAAFVDELYFPYDRVSIVTFDAAARVVLPFSENETQIKNTIQGLTVFSPDVCPQEPGTCRLYERDPITLEPKDISNPPDGIIEYYGLDCPIYHRTGNPDTCGTTNIGGGFLGAGDAFSDEDTFRQEALWVVILLTDGAANAPSYHCPNSTWTLPFCRDNNPTTRHCYEADDTYCLNHGGVLNPERYDTDDFARHMSDFVATEQDALVFTIGLGNLVRSSPPRLMLDASGNPTNTKCIEDDPETPGNEASPLDSCWGAGEQLLRYAADVGRGKYYYSPSGNQLKAIFLDIAQYLATRLTQ